MYSLVILYDYPLFTTFIISSIHFSLTILVIILRPKQDQYDFIKSLVFETFFSLIILCIFVMAFDQEKVIMETDNKFNLGWIIIGSSLFILYVEIIIDIKINLTKIY